MQYRPDIDGIRAIAVMSVIIAHAGLEALSGGFLGVDVFFVLSGFLITTIVKKDLSAGTFTIAGFYERRARRILPALLLVIACCIPPALWLMLPDFLQNFGQSVVATLLFSNNVLLALTSGYWELESSFKPLLHTWSLGVEEQFYLAYPILLVLIWRFKARVQVGALIAVGLLSLAFAEFAWRHYPTAGFYLPITRAWELMVGCVIVYLPKRPRPFDGVISLGCLGVLLLSMVVFTEATPSPSIYSATPVLATAGLLAFNRPETLAYRLLSLKPIVLIGLVSYSAYLWHQPLFAFARIASLEPPGAVEMAGLTALTLVLAAASYRFVETPFRNRAKVSLWRFSLVIVPACVAFLAFGLVLHFKQGFPRWSFPNLEAGGDVYITYNERVRQYAPQQGADDGAPTVVLIGNSYARDVGNILLESGALNGRRLLYLEKDPSCGLALTADDERVLGKASVVVFALNEHDAPCVKVIDDQLRQLSSGNVIHFGSKDFGYNINPFARVPMDRRAQTLARVPEIEVRKNLSVRKMLPEDRFIDQIELLGPDGNTVRFFDDRGNPLSPDRKHLTRYGAKFVAQRLLETTPVAWRNIVAAERSNN